ncbi:helix-turn-helix transcriptional regulator [Streptomyces sp. NPDC048669]|uniref:helix-turn-helix domain-containing protein n=1 Tax=Streptomyces sp. NPDC048669 TaxID=3155267 RepID=UPI003431242C
MSRDWVRLGHAIEAARDAKGMTQVALAAAAGVSESTVQNLEAGKERQRQPPSVKKVEAALHWAPGSADAVLAGGEPTPAELEAGRAPHGDGTAGLPLRIVQELSDGPLLDTTVLPLSGDSRMVIVVKGTPDASPDQIRRDLIAWAKAQAVLQNLDHGDGHSDTAN